MPGYPVKNLRHWAINYREKNGVKIPPPKTFKEISKLEKQFKKILGKYHNKREGELCYTLTIHPYSAMKTCARCGAEIQGIKRVYHCPECNNTGKKAFVNARWVSGWHWHLITNFYTDQLDHFSLAMKNAFKKEPGIGFQVQNLSKKSKRYPRGKITTQAMLERIITYEFSHAMYIPYRPRDVCRFLGAFHHAKYICKKGN